jgi:hypothetical protein
MVLGLGGGGGTGGRGDKRRKKKGKKVEAVPEVPVEVPVVVPEFEDADPYVHLRCLREAYADKQQRAEVLLLQQGIFWRGELSCSRILMAMAQS